MCNDDSIWSTMSWREEGKMCASVWPCVMSTMTIYLYMHVFFQMPFSNWHLWNRRKKWCPDLWLWFCELPYFRIWKYQPEHPIFSAESLYSKIIPMKIIFRRRDIIFLTLLALLVSSILHSILGVHKCYGTCEEGKINSLVKSSL